MFFNDRVLWEDFDFKDGVMKGHINKIFEELIMVNKISGVAISKMLHLFNPNFFIMWDNAIMENYGFYNNSEGYINFLQRIKMEITDNDLFLDYQKSEIKDDVSLLKLIDEYNMERMRD